MGRAMTDRRRNGLSCCSSSGCLARVGRRDRDEEDAPRASTSRAASSSSTRASPRRSSRRSPRNRSTARSTSCASASTSSASPSRRSSARARDQISVGLPDVKNAAARAAAGRQDRPAVLLRLGAERPRPGRQAGPDQPDARAATGAGHAARSARADAVAATRRQTRPDCARRQRTERSRARRRSTTLFDRRTKHDVLAGPGGHASEPVLPSDGASRAAGIARPCAVKPGHGRRPGASSARQLPARTSPTTAGTSSTTTRRCRAPTSRTRSRTSTTAPAAPAQPIVTFNFTGHGRDAVPERHASAIAHRGQQRRPARAVGHRKSTSAALRGRCSTNELITSAVRSTTREPGRHRRPQRRADLGRLHDHRGAGPRATC